MSNALSINGIYNGVLQEIIGAQSSKPGDDFFLQPFKKQAVAMLRKKTPTPSSPVRLYLSTTEHLNQISYTGEIVSWEDKRKISDSRRRAVSRHLNNFQPGEVQLFSGTGEHGLDAVNLITIRNLKQLTSSYSTSILRKVSDGEPLKPRTRSGGWSEVVDLGDLLELPVASRSQFDSDLTKRIVRSSKLSDATLRERLALAPAFPSRIQLITTGYQRNPDVIVAVLRRANGVCEKCNRPAPFLRKFDGTPYLEVHHWIPLSEGGEDTVENAGALCPNCHRQCHHGV